MWDTVHHRSSWRIMQVMSNILMLYTHFKTFCIIYFVSWASGHGYSSHTIKDPLFSSLIPCNEFDFPNVTIWWWLLSNTMSSIAKCCRLITKRSHELAWKPNKYPPVVPTHSMFPATVTAAMFIWSWGIPLGINCSDLIW